MSARRRAVSGAQTGTASTSWRGRWAQGSQGGLGCDPGGQSVVNQDHDAVGQRRQWSATGVAVDPALELDTFPAGDLVEPTRSDSCQARRIARHPTICPTFGDGADAQLFLSSPSFRATNTSSGAARCVAISKATGTAPRGNANTTESSSNRFARRVASRRPASYRSRKGMGELLVIAPSSLLPPHARQPGGLHGASLPSARSRPSAPSLPGVESPGHDVTTFRPRPDGSSWRASWARQLGAVACRSAGRHPGELRRRDGHGVHPHRRRRAHRRPVRAGSRDPVDLVRAAEDDWHRCRAQGVTSSNIRHRRLRRGLEEPTSCPLPSSCVSSGVEGPRTPRRRVPPRPSGSRPRASGSAARRRVVTQDAQGLTKPTPRSRRPVDGGSWRRTGAA